MVLLIDTTEKHIGRQIEEELLHRGRNPDGLELVDTTGWASSWSRRGSAGDLAGKLLSSASASVWTVPVSPWSRRMDSCRGASAKATTVKQVKTGASQFFQFLTFSLPLSAR